MMTVRTAPTSRTSSKYPVGGGTRVFNTDADVARACKACDFDSGPQPLTPLHPDTDPEAIRAAQRAEVESALSQGYRTPEELSERVVLPVSVVKLRLLEITQKRGRQV